MERRVPKELKATQERWGRPDPKGKQARWACRASRAPTAPRGRRESRHLTTYGRAWAFRESRVPRAWTEQRERRACQGREAPAACLGQLARRALLDCQEPKERRDDPGSQAWMVSLDPEERKVTGVNVERRGSEESRAGKV